MSRAITIQVSESVTRTIHVDDNVQTQLEILDISLPSDQKREILEKILEEHGYQKEDDEVWVRKDDDVDIRVSTKTLEVQVGVETTKEVTEQGEATARGYDDVPSGPTEKSEKARLRSTLERKIEVKEKKAQEELTRKLEKKVEDLKPELKEMAQKANKENLKQKARSMGEVLESSENGNDITIRIKV